MLRHGCLSAVITQLKDSCLLQSVYSRPIIGGALSGYGAFVVVILFHTCQYQCYINTYTEYRYQPFLQQICEPPEENNAVQLAPVQSTTVEFR